MGRVRETPQARLLRQTWEICLDGEAGAAQRGAVNNL